jgi:glycine/D-amino acid oxidase-like deaminating enzyme
MRTETAIAIIGGGVSGLTLARTLRDRGFSRVVVFERDPQVGGKVCTVDVDGRAHDLGATMGVPGDYEPVLRFSREANIATQPFPSERHFSLASGREVALNKWHEMPRVLAQAARYVALHSLRWTGVDGSGLHRAPAELYKPWREVASRYGLGTVSQRMLCYRTGYGYGFDDEVPAVMYANLIRPQTLAALAQYGAFVWRGGAQPIWTHVARGLEVRTASPVLQITRSTSGVRIRSRHGVEHFDRLVIACNPQDLAGVLDDTGPERKAFAQIRTYPYSTFACEVEGLEPHRASIGYLDDNMRRDRAGHPMAWVKRYADQSVFVFHLFAPPELPDAEIEKRIAADVARLGGRLRATRAVRRWKFFPHFTSDFMQRGGLQRIELGQGQNRTYLAGEVLSFSTMARTAEYATQLAQRIARERDTTTIAARLAS